jgi:hypothetical protein
MPKLKYPMWPWWNSVDGVETASLVLKWIAALLSGIGVLVAVGIIVLTHRSGTLKSLDKIKTELAARELANRLANTESELKASQLATSNAMELAKEARMQSAARHITEVQVAAFIDQAKNAPKGSLSFTIMGANKDVTSFTSELQQLLSKAGYGVLAGFSTVSATMLSPSAEVEIGIADLNQRPTFVDPLAAALNSIGVETKVIKYFQALGDNVEILVWPKQLK